MSALDRPYLGQVYQHLEAMLSELLVRLERAPGRVPECLEGIDRDPYYAELAAEVFHAPGLKCDRAAAATQRLQQVCQRVAALPEQEQLSVAPFIKNFERFLSDPGDQWRDTDYLIIPGVDQNHPDQRASLLYLYAKQLECAAEVDGSIRTSGLTADRALRSGLNNYFQLICQVMLCTFFQVKPLRFYTKWGVDAYAYNLMCGAQIHRGKSVGAAALAIFCISFLRERLGSGLCRVVDPRRGTVLTGEVTEDGRITRVDHAERKVAAVVDEFGSQLKVILPAENRLSSELEQRLGPHGVRYVSTAEELLAAVLGGGDDHRGLLEARRVVVGGLSAGYKQTLRQHLASGVEADLYNQPGGGLASLYPLRSRDAGVFLESQTCDNQLKIDLGLDAPAPDPVGGPVPHEIALVVVDGSDAMDAHWDPAAADQVCAVAQLLEEIAQRVDPRRQRLAIGLLSCDEILIVDEEETAAGRQQRLQALRDRLGLRHRGPFFRPALEGALALFEGRRLKILLVTDSRVPDWQDRTADNIASCASLRLSPGQDGDQDQAETSLFDRSYQLNTSLLRRHFSRDRGAIQQVRIHLGQAVPVEWSPPAGELRQDRGGFELSWSALDHRQLALEITMAHRSPRALRCRGTLRREAEEVPFEINQHPLWTDQLELSRPHQGKLTEQELETWRRLCDPDQACAVCGATQPHLFHDAGQGAAPVAVFSWLTRWSEGWLLLRAGCREWLHFQHGCQVNGVGIVALDGRPHCTFGTGGLSPLSPSGAGLYHLALPDDEDLYLGCKLRPHHRSTAERRR